jgi:hypothetical protein
MDSFDPKDPLEIIPLTFDFDTEMGGSDTIVSAAVAVSVSNGYDSNPASLLSGAASLLGDKVRQNVTAGLDGVDYIVKVTVTTTAGYKYTLARVLPVRNAGTY